MMSQEKIDRLIKENKTILKYLIQKIEEENE